MLQRATEDLKEIVVSLTPDQVKLLLQHAFHNDAEKSREAFERLARGTHTGAVLDRTVTLQNFEPEGFGATLLQMDKPRLDDTLAQLDREQHRRLARLRQAELERSRPGWRKQRDQGYERD